MKKISRLFLAVGLVVALSVGTSSAVTIYDIQNYDLSGKGIGSYIIGDKIFSDFSITTILPGDVTITGQQVGDVTYINFTGGFVTTSTAGIDYALWYAVESMGGPIAMIDQSFNLTSGGAGGIVAIGETVFNAQYPPKTAVAQSSIGFYLTGDYSDPPAEPSHGDQLFIDPALQKVWVEKDIFVQANSSGLVGATIITQSFHQAVPEPATMFLLGSGLIGLAGFARRRFRK